MKNLVILSVFLFMSSFGFSQDDTKALKISQVIEEYEDGSVRQEGLIVDEKPHGKWIAYNIDGSISMVGTYNNGIKDGVFIFITPDYIKEVLYGNNIIKEVKTWGLIDNMVTVRE